MTPQGLRNDPRPASRLRKRTTHRGPDFLMVSQDCTGLAHHKSSSYSITRARDRALRSHRNRSQIFVKNTFPVTEHSYVAMRFDQHVYLWIVQTLRATQTDRTRTAPQYKRLRQSRASQKGLSPMHDACCTRSLCIASQHHPARHGKHHVRLG